MRVSTSEQAYIERGVNDDVRCDGRSRLDRRDFALELGLVSQTNGSARLRLGDTDVLVGIKAEVSEPDTASPDKGDISVSVECCPSASPEFEGRGADALNTELARLMHRLLTTGMDLKQLCMIPGKQVWNVFLDCMVLDSDGSLFDALSFACVAALHAMKLPKVTVVDTAAGPELELSDDPHAYSTIDASNVPIAVTLCKVGRQYILDTTMQEELCMQARVTVGVSRSGRICTIQKGGHGALDPAGMPHLLKTAAQLGTSFVKQLDCAIEAALKVDSADVLGFFA